jgi:hypothetical protein
VEQQLQPVLHQQFLTLEHRVLVLASLVTLAVLPMELVALPLPEFQLVGEMALQQLQAHKLAVLVVVVLSAVAVERQEHQV